MRVYQGVIAVLSLSKVSGVERFNEIKVSVP
jgi:hypothetical protein